MPLELVGAVRATANMTEGHIAAVRRVAHEKNCFIILRMSERETCNLIDAGFATKSMDVHDKSSNWGLTAGMVPVDPRFSKTRSGMPIKERPKLQKVHGKAIAMHLMFDDRLRGMIGDGPAFHFNVRLNHGCTCGASGDFDHYSAPREDNFCFLISKSNGAVWWRDRVAKDKTVPMFVWAYDVRGVLTALTGDYDMWMVAPHISVVHGTNTSIMSMADEHGRSAATKFISDLIPVLNRACDREGNPVFNHGAEAQNYSFTQGLKAEERLIVFAAADRQPFVLPGANLPRLVFDMLSHGYVTTLNPKWRTGTTLGAEDLALAAHHDRKTGLPLSPDVQLRVMIERNTTGTPEVEGADALARVETAAAIVLQRRMRALMRPATTATGTPKLESKRSAVFAGPIGSFSGKSAQELDRAYRAAMCNLWFDIKEGKVEAKKAVDTLNARLFEGTNRGMALMLWSGFRWGQRVHELSLFRRIAEATNLKMDPATLGPELPADCFPAGAGQAALARIYALYDEAGFGRSRFIFDKHGHATAVDETLTTMMRPMPW